MMKATLNPTLEAEVLDRLDAGESSAALARELKARGVPAKASNLRVLRHRRGRSAYKKQGGPSAEAVSAVLELQAARPRLTQREIEGATGCNRHQQRHIRCRAAAHA